MVEENTADEGHRVPEGSNEEASLTREGKIEEPEIAKPDEIVENDNDIRAKDKYWEERMDSGDGFTVSTTESNQGTECTERLDEAASVDESASRVEKPKDDAETESENKKDEKDETGIDEEEIESKEEDKEDEEHKEEVKEEVTEKHTEEDKEEDKEERGDINVETNGEEINKTKTLESIEGSSADKLLTMNPSEKIESYSDDEIEIDYDTSSDSDSDSCEESDSSSDSDSEDDEKVIHDNIDELADDEDEPLNGPIVSKNEVSDESAPKLPEDYKVPENAPLELIGEITGLVEKSVIIKANISGEFRVLNDSSIFCFEDRTVLGPLFETFGRLQSPMYRVKFNDADEFNKLKDKKGKKVYYVVPDSQFLYTDSIKNMRGTDASNCHDEELPEEEQEFSDDERELAAKQSKKRTKKTKSNKENSAPNDPQPPKQTSNRKRHHGSTSGGDNQNTTQNSKYQPYGYPQNNQTQQFSPIQANSIQQQQHNNPLIHNLQNHQAQHILQLQQQQQQQHQQQRYIPQVQPSPQQYAPPPPPQSYNTQPQIQRQFQPHSLVYGTPYNQSQQQNILNHNQQPNYNQNLQLPNPYFPQGAPDSYSPSTLLNNYPQWNQNSQQSQLQQLQQLVVNHLNGQNQQQQPTPNQYPGGNTQFPPQN